MDHLCLDNAVQPEPDRIPYYPPGELIYRNEDVNVLLHKVSSGEVRSFARGERNNIIWDTFLQEHLFFGLLTQFSDIFGLHFSREDYITERGDHSYLTTSKLHSLADELLTQRAAAFRPSNTKLVRSLLYDVFKASGGHGDLPEALPAHLIKLGEDNCEFLRSEWSLPRKVFCLNDAGIFGDESNLRLAVQDLLYGYSQILCILLRQQLSTSQQLTLVCYSVLVESLVRLTDFTLGLIGTQSLHIQISDDGQLDSLWLQRCRQNRLCPQRLESLLQSGLPISQCYIATSMRSDTASDHTQCTFGQFCLSRVVLASLPLHDQSCPGDCQLRRLTSHDKASLERSIEQDGYGVLQFTGADCDLDFRVVPDVKGIEYVAFSHVWVHGLGNPSENGIPSCQLRRLKSLMAAADCDSHAFWLDPLCVPLDSGFRRLAVASMDIVYTRAAKVIVIDRDLIRCRGSNILRRLAMLTSDWITRIWTLQEAVLPGDRLYIAFADGIKNVDTIIKDWWDKDGLSAKSLIICSDETLFLQSLLCTGGVKFINLIESFHNRTTSHAEDEIICLAILLGVDVQLLPERPSIPDLVGKLPMIEQDVIFGPGPRSDHVGFRWCPTSFISASRCKTYASRQAQTQVGEAGIKLKKDIAIVGDVQFHGLDSRASGTTEHYLLLDFGRSLGEEAIVVFPVNDIGASAESLRSRLIKDAALVFERSSDMPDEATTAVLVSDTRMVDGEHRAHFECLVMTALLRKFRDRGLLQLGVNTAKIPATILRNTCIWVD